MDMQWLQWTRRLQAIAQAGLTYSKDVYDQERFAELRQISVEMMSAYTGVPEQKVADLFANETGYPTPKVDVRAFVIRDGRVLLVKEISDGKWSLPGGWADIGSTPGENAVKEVKEESGLDVRPVRLLAVWDRDRHPHPPHANYIYKIFILCEIVGGELQTSVETSEVGFFALDELPELSDDRVTPWQLQELFRIAHDDSAMAAFD